MLRSRARLAGLASALIIPASLLGASPASADPLVVSCPPGGCTVGVSAATAYALGIVRHDNTAAYAGAYAPQILGLVGEGGTFVGTQIGRTTTLHEVAFTYIGDYGGVGEAAGGDSSDGKLLAGASYSRYNLSNGENVSAVSATGPGSTSGSASAFAYEGALFYSGIGANYTIGSRWDIGVGASIGGDQVRVVLSTGPGGTTLTTYPPL